MSRQLIVYALGHQYDKPEDQLARCTALDVAINDILSVLDDAEKARTNHAIALCRRSVRSKKILPHPGARTSDAPFSACFQLQIVQSTAYQLLAARIEELLLAQIALASREEGIGQLTSTLWEMSILLDLAEQCLVDKQDLNSLLFHLQQELFPEARVLYQDWLHLQLQLWVRWIVYGHVPHNTVDFWIQAESDALLDLEQENRHAPPVWDAFILDESRLPPLLPVALAEKVLFLGKAVRVLSDASMLDENREKWLSDRIFDIFGARAQPSRADVPPVLSWNSLEATVKVDDMSQEIVKSLHHLLADEHRLTLHLQLLREFCLMQNGYFFHRFIERTQTTMYSKPTMNSERDVNLAFKEIGAEVIDDDALYALFSKLQLIFSPEMRRTRGTNLAEASRGYDKWFWGDLHLLYEVSGPLALILSPPILKIYDSLFQMMFAVRRAQTSLNQVWTSHRKRRTIPHAVWLLRAEMSHFIDHLASYLQVDVVAHHSLKLQDRISSAQTLDQLKRAHDEFIQDVGSQSFVQSLPIKRSIKEIVEICDAFCKLINEMVYENEFDAAHLNDIQRDYMKKTRFAFTLLSGVKGQALHLSKLLLMLDYNEFFTGGTDTD